MLSRSQFTGSIHFIHIFENIRKLFYVANHLIQCFLFDSISGSSSHSLFFFCLLHSSTLVLPTNNSMNEHCSTWYYGLDSCLYILYECSIALFARWNNSQIENCAQFHNSGKWKVNLYAKYERIAFSAPCSGPGDQMSINLRRNVNPFFPPNQLNSVILLYHYIVSMHSHYILFQINQRNNDFFRAFLVKCIFNAKGDFFSYKNRENNVILHFIQFQTLTILEYLRFNMIH